MPDSRDAIEREVQRRLTDRLAAAGVAPGQLSLETLFMLPPNFVRAYRDLFYKALEESPKNLPGSGGKAVPTARVIRGLRTTRGELPQVTGSAGSKRYRTHWVIRSEEAFKLKGSVDRKLGRLADEIQLASERRADSNRERAQRRDVSCPGDGCGRDLLGVWEVMGKKPPYCPWCGVGLAWD